MEINTDTTDKKPPPTFIKTRINNYLNFYNNIKKVIEPDFDFSCKNRTNALKLNLSSIIYQSINQSYQSIHFGQLQSS